MTTPSLQRYKGLLWWFQPPKFRKARHVSIERAILRPGELALDFSEGGDAYHITVRGADRAALMRGEWQRDRASRRGSAECRLLDAPLAPGDEGELILKGFWFEDGVDWKWCGMLFPVESFDANDDE